MKDGRRSTDGIVIAALAGLALWEAWTLVNKTPRDTISERVWRAMAGRPILPFAAGALAAHWVWQSQDVYDDIRKEWYTQ